MNDKPAEATKYVLVFERALEGVYTIGPFESEDAATKYARANHTFPQVWRVAELRTTTPEKPK